MTRSTSLRVMTPGLWAGFLLAGAWLVNSPALAQDVVAVLSSDSPPYKEALAGFEESYGHPVPTYTLSKGDFRLQESPRVIVTFGGKAALHPYPRGTTLIYALAAGILVGPDQHVGPLIKVRVLVTPEILMARLKEVQPALKRLAVFWISPTFIDHFHDLQGPAQARGITLHAERMNTIDELPSRLRALKGQADAFWMEPDPLIMTPGAFATAKEFGRSNNMPLYVPMDNLVDKGAAASVSCSFRENGRKTGQLAAQAVAGQLRGGEVAYIDKSLLTLNLSAAAQSGLTIPADVVKKADRVVP